MTVQCWGNTGQLTSHHNPDCCLFRSNVIRRKVTSVSTNETKQGNKADGNSNTKYKFGRIFFFRHFLAWRESAVLLFFFFKKKKRVQTWNLPNDPKVMQMEGNTVRCSCQPTGMEGILLSIASGNWTRERQTQFFTEDSLVLIKSAED